MRKEHIWRYGHTALPTCIIGKDPGAEGASRSLRSRERPIRRARARLSATRRMEGHLSCLHRPMTIKSLGGRAHHIPPDHAGSDFCQCTHCMTSWPRDLRRDAQMKFDSFTAFHSKMPATSFSESCPALQNITDHATMLRKRQKMNTSMIDWPCSWL